MNKGAYLTQDLGIVLSTSKEKKGRTKTIPPHHEYSKFDQNYQTKHISLPAIMKLEPKC